MNGSFFKGIRSPGIRNERPAMRCHAGCWTGRTGTDDRFFNLQIDIECLTFYLAGSIQMMDYCSVRTSLAEPAIPPDTTLTMYIPAGLSGSEITRLVKFSNLS